MTLEERESTAPAAVGTWHSIAACTSSGPSGRLQVHVASEVEMEAVRRALHDKAFQLGGDMISFTVTDDSALAAQTKNGRRGHRSRANPSAAAAPTL
jgi:hypothetical protein